MLKLYKNKSQSFECKISIEGANYSKAKPRMIFYPDSDSRNLMFEGTLKGSTCSIVLTPNVDINNTGKVVLEIVVDDSTLFRPWNSTYEILTEQAKVESESITLSLDSSSQTKKIVEDVKIVNERVIEPISVDKKEEEIQEEVQEVIENQAREDNSLKYMKKNWSDTPRDLVKEVQLRYKITANEAWKLFREVQSESDKKVIKEKTIAEEFYPRPKQLFTENCTSKNKSLVNEYLMAIKNLKHKERKSFLKYMNEDYVPENTSIKWAKPIFGDLNSLTARICMYCREVKRDD